MGKDENRRVGWLFLNDASPARRLLRRHPYPSLDEGLIFNWYFE